jgi:hypothetical protein
MLKIFPHNFPVRAQSVQNTPGRRPQSKGDFPRDNIYRNVDTAQGRVLKVMADFRLVDFRYLFSLQAQDVR